MNATQINERLEVSKKIHAMDENTKYMNRERKKGYGEWPATP